jgi:5-methylcytosine-specific restriction endonuclease McrA
MDTATRGLVHHRAEERCEYCRLRQEHSELRHHVEHIIAKQHGGSDDPENLALACHRCNLRKGPNLTGTDPQTGRVTRLFDPRHDRWSGHFVFEDVCIIGLTPVGRATVHVLDLNDARRLDLRTAIMKRGG